MKIITLATKLFISNPNSNKTKESEPIVEQTETNPQEKLVKVGYCEDLGCYIEQ